DRDKKTGTEEERRALEEEFRALAVEIKTGKQAIRFPPVRLMVDLKHKTITLGNNVHDVKSEQALRWVKVLAQDPGQWVSGPKLYTYDPEWVGARTDRLKKELPEQVKDLIESRRGGGSRLTIPADRNMA